MDQESGFYPAAQQVGSRPACISPLNKGLSGPISGRAQIFSSEGANSMNGEDGSDVDVERRLRVDERGESTAEEEIRQPRSPVTPGRPTRKEIEDHCVAHWPFRSWCRHCVLGRAQGSPHHSRGSLDRQMARSGPPTISMDHCFMGSADDESKAHGSPFLILYDNASEALYCIACSTKACTPWVVEYVYSILWELGYGGITVSIKCDQAPELKEIRKQVSMRRNSPTVPIDVPVRESKANGSVERAVKTWQGQFRTLKSHLEFSVDKKLPKDHPVFQWMAWWSASLLNRVAIKNHGRTVFEHTTGHRMKTPMCSFGEAVVWRTKRTAESLNKWDS